MNPLAKRWGVRALACLLLPLVVLRVLAEEVGYALLFACREITAEVWCFRQVWRTGSFDA